MTEPGRFAFPISLDVTGRRCLVLGGGFEATDKAGKLSRAGARVQVIAESVEPELEERALAGEVAWAARSWEARDVAGAFLVFLTPEDRERAAELSGLASSGGFLLCCIDVPEHCTFANPATFSAGELTVALSSGGRVPAVLRRLREDLEAALSTPRVRAFLGQMARMREELPAGERGAALREAASGFGLEVRVRFPAWFGDDDAGR